MRLATYEVYELSELSESAKEKARRWYREGMEYVGFDDAHASIKAFCDEFNVTIKDYSIEAYSYSYLNTDADDSNFRGRKVSNIPNKEHNPTGYYMDGILWYTFHEALALNKHGNALSAFNEAIVAAVACIKDDMEYQLSAEAIDESITCNEYEFYEDGSIAR